MSKISIVTFSLFFGEILRSSKNFLPSIRAAFLMFVSLFKKSWNSFSSASLSSWILGSGLDYGSKRVVLAPLRSTFFLLPSILFVFSLFSIYWLEFSPLDCTLGSVEVEFLTLLFEILVGTYKPIRLSIDFESRSLTLISL